MLKNFFVSALMALGMLSVVNAQESSNNMVLLKAGTPINLVTAQSISSRNSAIGTSVDLFVSSDVYAEGQVVIPAGTIVKGWVSDVRSATVLGIGGDLSITVDGLYATDGTYVPIAGANFSTYGSNKTALAVVCGLFTLVGYLISGEQAYINSRTPIQGLVMSNTYCHVD